MIKEEKYLVKFNLPIVNEYGYSIFDYPNNHIENLINQINIEINNNNLEKIKELIQQHNNNKIQLEHKHFILAFIIKNDKSTSLTDIDLIFRLSQIAFNDSLELSQGEITTLIKKVQESEMVALFKAQIINNLNNSFLKQSEVVKH